MDPGHAAYNIDWIFSNSSNVHVANHRAWFTKYTPFNTHLDIGMSSGPTCKVEGVGEVELTVKTHPNRGGSQHQRVLILHHVLHAPSSRCNILGMPIMDGYNVVLEPEMGRIIDEKSGACAGLLDHNRLYRLRLRGQRSNQSSLDPGIANLIRANWPASERASWEASRRENALSLAANSNDVARDNGASPKAASMAPPQTDATRNALTQTEKKWLKDNFAGEFRFLRDYGLSIYKEEDRDEGRRIMRAMMEDDDSSDDDDGSENSFLRELEEDPTSHVADHAFSEEQLDWIKKNFKHSGNFLLTYGLKPFVDGDCQAGKSILHALMELESR